jgi:hypothetical protein
MNNNTNRLQRVIIQPQRSFGTYYEKDEYDLLYDIVEEYRVYFDNLPIASFWVCNNYEDSIQLHTPMDLEILQYIISEMETRSLKKQWNLF